MFITNNHSSFHMWCKENLAKYQKVRKYFVHDCSLKHMLLKHIKKAFNRHPKAFHKYHIMASDIGSEIAAAYL